MTVNPYERRLGCGAIVQNQSGEVLLVRRRGATPGEPSSWALPVVEAEAWETSRQAAVRAVHKRAALVVDPEELAFALEWREDGPARGRAVWMLIFYRASARGAVIDHRRDPEVLEVRWIPPEGAKMLVGTGALGAALAEWLASGMAASYEIPPGEEARPV